jgi:hypothetical protein
MFTGTVNEAGTSISDSLSMGSKDGRFTAWKQK